MRSARCAGIASLVLALSVTGFTTAGAQAPESGQVIADWNATTLKTMNAAEVPLPLVFVNLAMVHGAMYDAVVSITGGYQPYLGAIEAEDGASATAAAAAAAHDVLVSLLPDSAADLDVALAATLESVPDGAGEDAGVSVGQAAAAAMIAERTDDGRGVPNPLTFGTGPGEYRPTPPDNAEFPGAWLAKLKPFVAPDGAYYRTAGPQPLDSAAYAAEYQEVLSLSGTNAGNQTPEQQAVAAFWQGAIPQWSSAMRQLTTGQSLDIARAARLFAVAGLAVGDAAVGCYDDKYHWMFWRPVTAIAEAANDGNDATEPDPAWVAAHEGSPPYPDHPSGFNCYSGAYAGALTETFGTDEMAFTVIDLGGGEPRSYTSFSQALDEVIEARILQGLHFRSADVQGAELGMKAAALAAERLAAID